MINNVVLVGRTTSDIDMRYSQQGTAIANFTLAVNRRFDKEKTDFIRCIAFKKSAELLAQHVKKGHQVGIEGSIQTGSYEKDGRTIYTTDIIVNNFTFLQSRNNNQQPNNQQPPQQQQQQQQPNYNQQPNNNYNNQYNR